MTFVVGFSGNIKRPSRTRLLTERILAGVSRQLLGDTACYDVVDAGPDLALATSRQSAPLSALDGIWGAMERCDALVVATPVYKASYSGLFKHVFDLLDKNALIDRPVLLAATGRLPEYGFVIEHQLRPLFGFFGARTLPFGVYASDADFLDADVLGEALESRIDAAVHRLGTALGSR